MTYEQVRHIIAAGESRTLELKKSTGELKDGMHAACAFLNTDGGWLVFGVAPTSLKIAGQQVTDNTQREIAQALSRMEPAVNVDVEYIDIPDKVGFQLVAMYFDGWVCGKGPYTYHGCPYYKVESTTQEMPRQMFEERLKAAKPQYYAWERQKAEGITVANLNEERIRGTVRLGVENGRMPVSALSESLEKVMAKLQLLNDGCPNNAAALLFANDITGYPQFRMRLARFRGVDKNSFLDNQRVEGNLFDMLDEGMAFFFKWLPLSGEIKGLKREERLEIPAVALRETLVNALCHRQYEKYNLTIGIAIYDDRIEIENPGFLPPPITTESIKEPHVSIPYNPIVADVLYKTTYLENWGSGAQRIIDACREYGVPEPTWTISQGFVIVTFPRPAVAPSKKGVTEGVTEGVTDKLVDELGETKVSILRMVAANPKITILQMAEQLHISRKSVNKHIAAMRGKYIRREGSTNHGSWQIINGHTSKPQRQEEPNRTDCGSSPQ